MDWRGFHRMSHRLLKGKGRRFERGKNEFGEKKS